MQKYVRLKYNVLMLTTMVIQRIRVSIKLNEKVARRGQKGILYYSYYNR